MIFFHIGNILNAFTQLSIIQSPDFAVIFVQNQQQTYPTVLAHLSQYLSTMVAPSTLKKAVCVAGFPHATQK